MCFFFKLYLDFTHFVLIYSYKLCAQKEQSTFKTVECFDLKGIETVDSLFLLHIILVLCHIQGMTSSSSLLAAGLNNTKSAALVVSSICS